MFKTSEEYYEYFDKTYLKSKDQVEEFYGQDYQQVKEKTCKEYFNGLRENMYLHQGFIFSSGCGMVMIP
jgi:hypothetical protein